MKERLGADPGATGRPRRNGCSSGIEALAVDYFLLRLLLLLPCCREGQQSNTWGCNQLEGHLQKPLPVWGSAPPLNVRREGGDPGCSCHHLTLGVQGGYYRHTYLLLGVRLCTKHFTCVAFLDPEAFQILRWRN